MQSTPNYCDESCPLEHLDADVRAAVQEIQEEISSLMTNINRCLEQVQHDIKRVNRLNECLSCMVETMDIEIEELLSCILRKLTAGFAEQNGRNAELKRPECGLATAGANS